MDRVAHESLLRDGRGRDDQEMDRPDRVAALLIRERVDRRTKGTSKLPIGDLLPTVLGDSADIEPTLLRATGPPRRRTVADDDELLFTIEAKPVRVASLGARYERIER